MRNAAIIAALLAGTAAATDIPCSAVPREACEHDVDMCLWTSDGCVALADAESGNDCNQIDGDEDQCNKNQYCVYNRIDGKCNNRDATCGHHATAADCASDDVCFWNRDVTGWSWEQWYNYAEWTRYSPTGKAHCAEMKDCSQMNHLKSVCNDHPACYYDAAWEQCRSTDDVFTPDNVGGVGWYAGDPCAIKDKKACNEDPMCAYDDDALFSTKCESKSVRDRLNHGHDQAHSESAIKDAVLSMECGEMYSKSDCRMARDMGHTCKWNKCNVKGVGYAYCQDTTVAVPEEAFPSLTCMYSGGGYNYDASLCAGDYAKLSEGKEATTEGPMNWNNDKDFCYINLFRGTVVSPGNYIDCETDANPNSCSGSNQSKFASTLAENQAWEKFVTKTRDQDAALDYCYTACAKHVKDQRVVGSINKYGDYDDDSIFDDPDSLEKPDCSCYGPADINQQRGRVDDDDAEENTMYYGHYDCHGDFPGSYKGQSSGSQSRTTKVNRYEVWEMTRCRYDRTYGVAPDKTNRFPNTKDWAYPEDNFVVEEKK